MKYSPERSRLAPSYIHVLGHDTGAFPHRHRRGPGVDHGHSGHDDRRRRPRHPGPRLPRLRLDHPMGHDRLPPGAGHGHPGDRVGHRPVRAQADLHALAHRVPRRLQPVRSGLVGQFAHRLPRPAGTRRRHDPACRAVHAGPCRRAATHGPGDECHRRPDRAGPDPRARARWFDRFQLQLALDLLHQRADRHRHPRAGEPVPQGE